MKKRLPNFLGIGVQRAATTWVYECLREHPDVFVPKQKELHFFNKNYNKGLEFYCKYFEKSEGYKAVGEITPNYFNNKNAIPRMASVVPGVKLFLIFRDPIERAYSAYIYLHRYYRKMSFKEACQDSDYLLRLSLYSDDLQRLLNYYDQDKIKIFLYDDIVNNPHQVIRDIYYFLQIEEKFVPEAINQFYNAIFFPKFQNLLTLLKLDIFFDIFKSTFIGKSTKNNLIKMQKRKNIKMIKKGINQLSASQDEEYINELRKYFHDDIKKLEKTGY